MTFGRDLSIEEVMSHVRSLPKDFFWRRIHSLAGIWLIFFIIEHLLTNSQTALFLGDDGKGFIESVNWIHSLPYLPVIEIAALGVPFLVHGLWGIKYARQAKLNSLKSDGTKPGLGRYRENRAFTWQRITSWILIFGVVAHVVQMRFMEYPAQAKVGAETFYAVHISEDPGLMTLAERLDFQLFTENEIEQLSAKLEAEPTPATEIGEQNKRQKQDFAEALRSKIEGEGRVVAVAKNFGTASLLVVRDTFKSPLMIILYTLFVIAATYHAFNGLWTAFITWGVNITQAAQDKFRKVSNSLMGLVMFLGLASVWLTYINLRY